MDRAAGLRADVPKVPADPGGGEPFRWDGPFPGTTQVGCERAGEPQLGVGGEDQPGPAVRRLGGADLRAGPAEGVFEQSEGVLDVEAPQVCLPQAAGVCGGGLGAGSPQPDRLGGCSAGRVADVQADHRPLDDRECAVGLGSGGSVGQFGMKPVPGAGGGGAVETGVGEGFGVRGAPGAGLSEDGLASVPGRPALGVRQPGWDSPV